MKTLLAWMFIPAVACAIVGGIVGKSHFYSDAAIGNFFTVESFVLAGAGAAGAFGLLAGTFIGLVVNSKSRPPGSPPNSN